MQNEKNELETIFNIQQQFSKKIFSEKYNLDVFNLSPEEKIKWNKEYILAATNEIYEMLNELKWKTHRDLHKNENVDNFIEEGIDVFKFLLNILIINGCNREQFFNKFINKSQVVDIRYEQEKKLKYLRSNKTQPIAIIDIDGVLNNYPIHFLDFCADNKHKFENVPEFKESNIDVYNKLKHIYRITGFESLNIANKEAVNFLKTLKEKGYVVVLLSARPYEKIKRLYNDTINWLLNNEFEHDFLFFNKEKDKYVIDNLKGCNIAFCVDDDISNATNFSYHFNTYLMKNEKLYNSRSYEFISKKLTVINSLKEITI